VLIRAVHVQRQPEAQGLVGPHLVVEAEEALDLLSELRRLADLALAEVLALERAVEALDDGDNDSV
jgi:hypothetical protein